jgi:hypothetical protein
VRLNIAKLLFFCFVPDLHLSLAFVVFVAPLRYLDLFLDEKISSTTVKPVRYHVSKKKNNIIPSVTKRKRLKRERSIANERDHRRVE